MTGRYRREPHIDSFQTIQFTGYFCYKIILHRHLTDSGHECFIGEGFTLFAMTFLDIIQRPIYIFAQHLCFLNSNCPLSMICKISGHEKSSSRSNLNQKRTRGALYYNQKHFIIQDLPIQQI